MEGGEEDFQSCNHLRAWREYRGLTQVQLAAVVGTEGSVISLLESGNRGLSGKWLRRLAPALGTTAGLLLEYAPHQVGEAISDIRRRFPELEDDWHVQERPKDVPSRKHRDETPARSGEKVVKIPKLKREEDKDPEAGSNEN